MGRAQGEYREQISAEQRPQVMVQTADPWKVGFFARDNLETWWVTWGAKDCNPYYGTRYLTFGNGNGITSGECTASWEARPCNEANLLLSQARGASTSFHLRAKNDCVLYESSEIVRVTSLLLSKLLLPRR